ncbi:hypothetical protein GCM10010915_11820 [Microbacterium faecale]|uniref:Uncharacterized protein n=1 Tax=Microbacterium faecale TaxID=1804630 RepID=A0A916Y827_9MICO|nr:hypothetical protein [Microbacterium faecale]GGD33080.1 hypothetical protein GCM10010915_11820 [Microbacterium faecale]
MALKAQQVDRDLHLTVEGAATFVIRPLPGRVGKQITDTYLDGAAGHTDGTDVELALMMAVDGAQWDDETGRYVPLPEEQRTVYNRVSDELRLGEAESILLPAFFWQTILGITGVNAYIEGGEGIAGGVKALWALVARLGVSPLQTSPSSALESLIRLASTPTTTSPTGGVKSDG